MFLGGKRKKEKKANNDNKKAPDFPISPPADKGKRKKSAVYLASSIVSANS